METASFSETSPRKYKSGGINVGEDCNRPVSWTWAVCEFVRTAVVCHVCPTIDNDIPPASLEMSAETCVKCPLVFCVEMYREMPAQSPGPDINCHIILFADWQSLCAADGTSEMCWCDFLLQMLRIFESASPTAPVAVLCTLQDSCTVHWACPMYSAGQLLCAVSVLSVAVRYIHDYFRSNISPGAGCSDRF